MTRRCRLVGCALLGIAIGCAAGLAARAAADEPETVMVTLRAKPGAEDQLAAVIARHYETARRLNMLRADAPHVTVRGRDEHDTSYFVDIFTWRDSSLPDTAPREIQSIWQEMNTLTEKRSGHPALEIVEVTPVTPPITAR
jgi:hypothetical protein